MTPRFGRVAVLGLGLLGGSVALAAKARGVATRVAGATRSAEALAAALRQGALDEAGSYAEAARGADLVVLATPVFAMADVVRQIAPVLRPPADRHRRRQREGGAVRDAAGPAAARRRATSAPTRWRAAICAASATRDADLFEGAVCIVTQLARRAPRWSGPPNSGARSGRVWYTATRRSTTPRSPG